MLKAKSPYGQKKDQFTDVMNPHYNLLFSVLKDLVSNFMLQFMKVLREHYASLFFWSAWENFIEVAGGATPAEELCLKFSKLSLSREQILSFIYNTSSEAALILENHVMLGLLAR